MACVVLSDKSGKTAQTVDCPELKELVAAVNKATGRRWEVERRVYIKRHFFKRDSAIDKYSVYLDCHGEWQMMNFAPTKPGGWSLNYDVDYQTVCTMLHWYLNGLEEGQNVKV